MKRDVGAKFCTDFSLSHKNAIFHLLASPVSCLVNLNSGSCQLYIRLWWCWRRKSSFRKWGAGQGVRGLGHRAHQRLPRSLHHLLLSVSPWQERKHSGSKFLAIDDEERKRRDVREHHGLSWVSENAHCENFSGWNAHSFYKPLLVETTHAGKHIFDLILVELCQKCEIRCTGTTAAPVSTWSLGSSRWSSTGTWSLIRCWRSLRERWRPTSEPAGKSPSW